MRPNINALAYDWKANSCEFDSLTFKSGRRFRDGQDQLNLGEILAESLNKKVGDTLTIRGAHFAVTGTTTSPVLC